MRNDIKRTVPKGVLPDSDGKLGEKSVSIMRMLASGLTAEAIQASDPAIKIADIALAAREALILNKAAQSYKEKLDKIVERHPRAYDIWTREEEQRIIELYRNGKTLREIAAVVQRQPSAVKNRLDRLGLFT